jgi:hypothetical protein
MAPDRTDEFPPEPDTARLAALPVEEPLPEDAPDRAQAAVDDVPSDLDPEALGTDTGARRDPRSVMAAYAAALADADAGVAASLFAENSLLITPAVRLTGRQAIHQWHDDLLDGDESVTPALSGQGNDKGRLDVETAGGRFVVELSLDASGRIGTARWLTQEEASRAQEEQTRTAI